MQKKQKIHLASVLNYFLVGLIWFLIDEDLKKSSLVSFHAKQALNLFIFAIVFSVIVEIMSIISSLIMVLPIMGLILARIIGLIILGIGIGFLILWIFGIINSANREKRELPLIGKLAEKYLTF